MRPWRVGRAMKPHDYASWLRGSLTAHPCADSELARIHSGHPAGLFSANSPPRNGMKVKGTQRCCVVRRQRRMLRLLIHPPVPVGKCWTDQPLAGRAGSASSAAAQDVPSAEPGQCLRTRTASPCGRQAIGSHLWPTFLCEEKGRAAGGSPAKRLTSLATANKEKEAAGGCQSKRLTNLATANNRSDASARRNARPDGRKPTSSRRHIKRKIKMGRRQRQPKNREITRLKTGKRLHRRSNRYRP